MFLCRAMSSMPSDSGTSQKPAQSDQSGPTNISREDSSSAVSDVDNNIYLTDTQNGLPASNGAMVLQIGKKELQKQKWNRSQAFDAWTWSSFYSYLNAVKNSKNSYLDSLARCERCHDLYWRDEKHCKICHTTFELDFDLEEKYVIHASTCRQSSDTDTFPKHKVLSSQLQSIKAASYAIEVNCCCFFSFSFLLTMELLLPKALLFGSDGKMPQRCGSWPQADPNGAGFQDWAGMGSTMKTRHEFGFA